MSKRMEGIASVNQYQNHMQVSDAVIFAVADAEGVSPLELTPLTNVINPDALNNFIDGLSTTQETPTGFVEFEYRGHVIRVTADGTIAIDETDLE